MAAYHDWEWGRPVHDSRALWEMLMLEGFQAGLSWRTILRRREGFRAAFQGFEPETVARFNAADIRRLMADAGIIRSRAKIEATIGGARAYLAMQAAGEDFAEFAWGMASGKPSVAFRFDLDDGRVVVAQTSMRLFLLAADMCRARFGEEV